MSRDKNLLMDVWLVSLLASRLVEGIVRGTPLSVDEWALFGLIADLGPVTPAQLAQWTGLPPTSLSAMIRRCELRGELERTPNPHDRRSHLVRLSTQGQERYQELVEPFLRTLGELRQALLVPEPEVRNALQHLDGALRSLLSVPDRPYRVGEPTPGEALVYEGRPLTVRQRREALTYIDWLRHRDLEKDETAPLSRRKGGRIRG
ncbi:MAG: MarR family transcriptional regulator [Actinobacteria bacterium]|nr:MarR family transcriptional regulator [Actinomycetota bacterium]